MKRIVIAVVALFAGVSQAAPWNCSALCGYMDGAGLQMSRPLTLVTVTGDTVENAFEAARTKCNPVTPPGGRTFLVKRVSITTTKLSDAGAFADPVTAKEACFKE